MVIEFHRIRIILLPFFISEKLWVDAQYLHLTCSFRRQLVVSAIKTIFKDYRADHNDIS